MTGSGTTSKAAVRNVALPRDRWLAAAGLVGYAGLGWRFRHPPRGLEQQVFAAINHHGKDHPVLRVPQQLGTPWILPGLALGAFWLRRPRLAIVAGCALPAEKALEVGFKKVIDRKRPAQADPDAVLHDDAPEGGPSYPSGHAAIASTAAFAVSPYLPTPVVAACALGAAAAGLVRLSQGAHFPMDAVGGVFLGLTVASGLTAVVGRPAS
jgi:undecaprenyl-diphosphatase